jgi:hypothetical protein
VIFQTSWLWYRWWEFLKVEMLMKLIVYAVAFNVWHSKGNKQKIKDFYLFIFIYIPEHRIQNAAN